MKRRLYRKHHRVRHAAASVALLFLTACAGTAEPGATADTAKPETATRTEPDRPAHPPTPPTPPVNDNPAQIIGMAPAALDNLLGAPVRVRHEGGAEIRQYRAANVCQLDAFVYRDGSSGQRVTHVEIRRGIERLDNAGARACLRHMLAAPATS